MNKLNFHQKAFVAGVFSGKGSVRFSNNTPVVSLRTGSLELADLLFDFFGGEVVYGMVRKPVEVKWEGEQPSKPLRQWNATYSYTWTVTNQDAVRVARLLASLPMLFGKNKARAVKMIEAME